MLFKIIIPQGFNGIPGQNGNKGMEGNTGSKGKKVFIFFSFLFFNLNNYFYRALQAG